MSLDLGNNRLGDRGGYQIIDALVEPDPDLLLRQELGVDSSDGTNQLQDGRATLQRHVIFGNSPGAWCAGAQLSRICSRAHRR